MLYNLPTVKPEDKIIELGMRLPELIKPVAAYVPVKKAGRLLFTAGQLPIVGGKAAFKGKLGNEISLAQGQEAAKICLLNALAAIKGEIKELSKIKSIVRLNGYIASAASFIDQAKLMNPISELLEKVFGESGKHTRVSVGVAALPLDVPVEIDLIVEV